LLQTYSCTSNIADKKYFFIKIFYIFSISKYTLTIPRANTRRSVTAVSWSIICLSQNRL